MQDFKNNAMKQSILFLFCAFLFISCNSQKKIAGNYKFKTQCLGIEMDGSQTVKAWGNGRNRWDAIEQAKKNAVADVLFVGIREGKQDCNQKPIIFEVNAREKYQDYFDKFFADKGEYKEFISLKDERIMQKISRNRKGATQSVTHGVVLRVFRNELKNKMLNDGMLKN
ncbi:MAG TPA: hypothetical protein PLP27_05250 [Crocinitomicaceae bacterium]|nr:hypothetical protein [Crocinitomicaceae bacterium]